MDSNSCASSYVLIASLNNVANFSFWSRFSGTVWLQQVHQKFLHNTKELHLSLSENDSYGSNNINVLRHWRIWYFLFRPTQNVQQAATLCVKTKESGPLGGVCWQRS